MDLEIAELTKANKMDEEAAARAETELKLLHSTMSIQEAKNLLAEVLSVFLFVCHNATGLQTTDRILILLGFSCWKKIRRWRRSWLIWLVRAKSKCRPVTSRRCDKLKRRACQSGVSASVCAPTFWIRYWKTIRKPNELCTTKSESNWTKMSAPRFLLDVSLHFLFLPFHETCMN